MRNIAAAFAASLAKSRPLAANPLGALLSPGERALFVRNILELSAARGFGTVPVIEFFATTGLPAEDIYDRARRASLYDLVQDHWDSRLVAPGASVSAELAPEKSDGDPSEKSFAVQSTALRDVFFDLAMNRFEAMEEQRKGALSLLNWPLRNLAGPPIMAGAALRTARRLFFLAGQDSLPADPRHAAVAVVLWRAEQAWRGDESGDFARLMARLDGDLRQIEDLARRVRRFGRRDGQAPA